MVRYCFGLEFEKNEEAAVYDWWLKKAVLASMKKYVKHGCICNVEINRTGNQLLMNVDASPVYWPELKYSEDTQNPVAQEWEKSIENFQQTLPWPGHGRKWVLVRKFFSA